MLNQTWKSEAEYFDRVAETHAAALRPFEELDLARYRVGNLRRRFAREFRLRVLGGIEGKRVLDVGCGEGIDTVLLARLGAAHVTGVDLSPGAIALGERRAQVNGVADRVSFTCAPIETAELAGGFDVVWCNAILHHLTHDLDRVLGRLAGWARPGGVLSFAEPTSFSPTLRRLRRLVPLSSGGATPDERPLEPRDLAVVRRHVPELALRHFTLLGRVDQFVLTRFNYERSSAWRRAIVNATGALDWALLALPGIDRLGSISVMWGRPAR